MDLLSCQRVGHGYRIFDDPSGQCYSQARERQLHFEVSQPAALTNASRRTRLRSDRRVERGLPAFFLRSADFALVFFNVC